MPIVMLFIIAKPWSQPRRPVLEDRLNALRCIPAFLTLDIFFVSLTVCLSQGLGLAHLCTPGT